jgi:hypothetical protein
MWHLYLRNVAVVAFTRMSMDLGQICSIGRRWSEAMMHALGSYCAFLNSFFLIAVDKGSQ